MKERKVGRERDGVNGRERKGWSEGEGEKGRERRGGREREGERERERGRDNLLFALQLLVLFEAACVTGVVLP